MIDTEASSTTLNSHVKLKKGQLTILTTIKMKVQCNLQG